MFHCQRASGAAPLLLLDGEVACLLAKLGHHFNSPAAFEFVLFPNRSVANSFEMPIQEAVCALLAGETLAHTSNSLFKKHSAGVNHPSLPDRDSPVQST